jgi:hypothetical protein
MHGRRVFSFLVNLPQSPGAYGAYSLASAFLSSSAEFNASAFLVYERSSYLRID